ncbi:hypothetical protein KHA80_12535 [Anaerobacillus sp. HL2]|nr:hypothetical protein KHA80_12535 [Anaerobacillus sp. HL2]
MLERAEQLVNSFLFKLEQEGPNLIHKIKYPDIQYAVINVQRFFGARNGYPENLDLLTDY